MYCTAADQIGNMRPNPAGSTCDIGAIESPRGMPLATETPTSTPTSTHTATATYTASPTASATRVRVDIIVDADCPLPAAVISANTDSNTHDSDCIAGYGDDTIILPTGGRTLLTATLNITDNLTITGNGHSISGGEMVRVISATHNLTLNNVTIRDGRVVGQGAGLVMRNESASNAYTLTIDKSAFIDNQGSLDDSFGGAIYVLNPGQVTIRSSTFSGNSARNAGAIVIVASIEGMPRAELIHVTLANNTTHRPGAAAISFSGIHVGIRNSIIANNAISIDCTNLIIEVTNSIIEGANSCETATLTSDPALGSLTGNYYPLLDTSPAIGAGNAAHCTAYRSNRQYAPESGRQHL